MGQLFELTFPEYAMKSFPAFLSKNRYYGWFLLIFLITEILINPLGNFPLNDDWSYSQSVNIYYKDNLIFLGNWPAMTLCTQILWGFLFQRLFGASLFVLRCSTIVMALIGYAFLNKLVVQISNNKRLAFWAMLVLMFCPLVCNLTNTFMTDMNFNSLFIICIYFMFNFYRSGRILYYLGFLVFSVALVLLRQFGLIFPACFLLSAFFVKEKKWRYVLLAVIVIAVTLITLKIYEDNLKLLMPEGHNYKFSGSIKFNAAFFKALLQAFTERYSKITMYILIYTVPFASVFLPGLIKQASLRLWLPLALLSAAIAYCLLQTMDTYPTPEVFNNMRLGDETFFGTRGSIRHHYFPRFDTIMMVVKFFFSTITLFVALLAIFVRPPVAEKHKTSPEFIFLIFLIPSYILILLISDSFFDRYHIPMITTVIILFCYKANVAQPKFAVALIPFVFWAYCAVAGTKDYLEWNRQRWNAYWYLRTQAHVPWNRINGGFEVNCWREGRGWGWGDYLDPKNFDYLIQPSLEPGYKVIKEFTFQRYFPYRKDKMYVFVSEDYLRRKAAWLPEHPLPVLHEKEL